MLGNPDDNPLIKFLLTEKFLPYAPDAKNFPGNGRGLVSWQLDGVGRGQESATLIAYDETGMNEAVGSFYEAAAGLEPLTKFTWPTADSLTPAQSAGGTVSPAAPIAWKVRLPDRVVKIQAAGDGLKALSSDGSWTNIGAGENRQRGKRTVPPTWPMPVNCRPSIRPRPSRMPGQTACSSYSLGQGQVAAAYWGGTLRVADEQGKVQFEQQMPQDITSLAWSQGKLLAGLADGQLFALDVN